MVSLRAGYGVVGLLFGLLISGCLSANTAQPPTPAPPVTTVYSVDCPGGSTRQTNPGLCAGTLGGSDESLSEPNLAGHPVRAKTWALGVNSISLRPRDVLSAVEPRSPGAATGLYVTHDDGATWTPRGLPVVPGYVYFGDPSLVFDPQGRLHFTGLLFSQTESRAVFYGRSPDLGATWDAQWVRNDGQNPDRNWVSLGPDGTVFITWQRGGGGPQTFTQVAWSTDGGSSWTDLGAEARVAGCNLQTQVVVDDQGPVFACMQLRGGAYFTQVYRLNIANRSVTPVSRLGSPTGTLRLDLDAAGMLLLSMPTDDGVLVRRSTDGGRTWERPLNVRALATVDDAWMWFWPSWSAPDPHGGLHFLLVGGTGSNCYRATCENAAREHQVVHVSVDPANRRLLTEETLTPRNEADRPRSEPRAVWAIGDEFHGIAFGAEGGFLAWGHHQSVDFAKLSERSVSGN